MHELRVPDKKPEIIFNDNHEICLMRRLAVLEVLSANITKKFFEQKSKI
jgi:hypothetical protein